jgi:hypothetical protein
LKREGKKYSWVEPYVTKTELIETLVKGLDRALTHQEASVTNWICDCDTETRGILLDLFKELVQNQKDAN